MKSLAVIIQVLSRVCQNLGRFVCLLLIVVVSVECKIMESTTALVQRIRLHFFSFFFL